MFYSRMYCNDINCIVLFVDVFGFFVQILCVLFLIRSDYKFKIKYNIVCIDWRFMGNGFFF